MMHARNTAAASVSFAPVVALVPVDVVLVSPETLMGARSAVQYGEGRPQVLIDATLPKAEQNTERARCVARVRASGGKRPVRVERLWSTLPTLGKPYRYGGPLRANDHRAPKGKRPSYQERRQAAHKAFAAWIASGGCEVSGARTATA